MTLIRRALAEVCTVPVLLVIDVLSAVTTRADCQESEACQVNYCRAVT